MLVQHQRRLDLGIVVRIVGGEQLDRLAVQHLEAAGRVGHALAGEQRDGAREDADPDAPRRRRAIAVGAGEARADADVGLVREHDLDQRRQLGRVVLAVAVDADASS